MGLTATVRGVEYPLCLTVAALEDIEGLCGSFDEIGAYLEGMLERDAKTGELKKTATGTTPRMLAATTRVLGILIRRGEDNRIEEARAAGEDTARRKTPGPDELVKWLRPAEAGRYRLLVLDAINEGLSQKVEVEQPKNAEAAGR